jgi:hypothetical protein
MLTHAFTLVPMMYGALQRPFMTSEFSYRGGDTAHPNTMGAPPTVSTQTDRGVGYLSYVATMASLPFYVGTVWFCYGDQDTEIKWKGYGEDCNYGMIDRSNRPYAVLTEIMRQTNRSIYELAADPVKSKICPLFWRTELLRWDREYDRRMLKEYGRIDAPPDPFTGMLPSDRQFHHTYWITHRSPNLIVNDPRFFGACQANMIRSTPQGHELVLIGCRGLMTMPKRLWLGDQCTRPDESHTVESNAQVLVRRLDKAGRLRQITLVDGSFVMTDFTRMELRCPGKVPYLDIRFDPDAKTLAITSRGPFDRLGLRDVADWKATWNDRPTRVLKPEEYAAPEGMTVFAAACATPGTGSAKRSPPLPQTSELTEKEASDDGKVTCMPLTVKLDLPPDVEEKLRREARDLDADVKEAYALELFRQRKLSHYELSRVLGLDHFETDGWLKRHNVFEGSLTMGDLEADRQTLERVLGKAP